MSAIPQAIERGFSCRTCAFYSPHHPQWSDQPLARGQCRRYAPVLDKHQDGGLRTAWPMVSETSFCGEHAELVVAEQAGDEEVEAAAESPQSPEPKPVPAWRCGNCAGIWHSDDRPAKCTACQCRELSEIA